MIEILRNPDDIKIYCEKSEIKDASVNFEINDRKLFVYITAQKEKPRFICLRWNFAVTDYTRIMGDKWERSYGDMEWRSLNGEVFMPWYFLANSGSETVGCGVMTGANSFVSFQCDAYGCTAWLDVRCGGTGVELNGRTLLAGVIVCEHYRDMPAFQAAREFCRVMCENPRLPKEPVYGSNNWYYAYGKSSREDILKDADIIAKLAGNNANKPFMVIDDGWSVNSGAGAGPWIPNEKYGDMSEIASEFKKRGVRPGLWFRPLHDKDIEEQHPEWRIKKLKNDSNDPVFKKTDEGWLGYLDPTVPEVQEYIRDTTRNIKKWGFELIKHDFSNFDMFGVWGSSLNGKITVSDGWTFNDKTKTSAEIVLDFYRLIREAAGDMIIIGCNTVSHLSAGIFELCRIGDDTSGRIWSRTRAYGINTLAFRLCQNDTFYKVDADCVGIIKDKIDWKLNRQWLDLLSKSGSPLFVSVQPEAITDEIKEDLINAFKINSVQNDVAQPLDWLYNNQPRSWLINNVKTDYDFIMDSYPELLNAKTQPV